MGGTAPAVSARGRLFFIKTTGALSDEQQPRGGAGEQRQVGGPQSPAGHRARSQLPALGAEAPDLAPPLCQPFYFPFQHARLFTAEELISILVAGMKSWGIWKESPSCPWANWGEGDHSVQ